MRALGLLVGLVGCVGTNQVVCPDGRVCPANATCVEVATATYCATPGQLDACEGVAEGATCEYESVPSACHGGVCIATGCGNGLTDPGEVCDDGNVRSGDGCSAECQSTEECGNRNVDAVAGEQCDDGNGNAHDGCSPSCIAEIATWSLLPGQRPKPRFETALAYDSHRQRTVMFAGDQNIGLGTSFHDDTSEWDGARWVEATPQIHPSKRYGHQMAFDAARGVTVLFSGNTVSSDTWLWDGVQWRVATTTMSPPPRLRAGMTYDSRRKRIILFGGSDGIVGSRRNDTWEWSAPATGEPDWRPIDSSMIQPRTQTHMAYDPKRDRVVLYGGSGMSGPLQDLWELDGDTWSRISETNAPGPRMDGAMAFDPISQHIVLMGGNTAQDPSEVWDWDGTTWTKRPVNAPLELYKPAVTTDTARGRIVVWQIDGIYELAGTQWSKPASGAPYDDRVDDPVAVSEHIAVLDTQRRHVVVHGGNGGSGVRSETLIWDGSWTSLGAGPSARDRAAAAFDRARGEVVMFGGNTSSVPSPPVHVQDTYTFATGWTTKNPTTVPGARSDAAMAYDDVHGEIVMFGGTSSTETPANSAFDDTWIWNGTNWLPQSPAQRPSGRYGAAIGYDEARRQIVMFGGHDGAGLLNDTWIWDGTARTWNRQTTMFTPSPRFKGQLAWDRARARLVLYGGRASVTNDVTSEIGEVWEWTGTTWELVRVDDGPLRYGHQLVTGPDGGVLMFHGATTFGREAGVWLLRHDGISEYETCTSADSDDDGAVACADSDCAFVCDTCGDATCDAAFETCASCPGDCGTCPMSCGDGVCTAGEQCPGDCP